MSRHRAVISQCQIRLVWGNRCCSQVQKQEVLVLVFHCTDCREISKHSKSSFNRILTPLHWGEGHSSVVVPLCPEIPEPFWGGGSTYLSNHKNGELHSFSKLDLSWCKENWVWIGRKMIHTDEQMVFFCMRKNIQILQASEVGNSF